MGIWGRLRYRVEASYREARTDALRQANEAVPASLRLSAEDFGGRREQDPAAGQHVGEDRARYLPAAEAEALLVPGGDGRQSLRLVGSGGGLDLAAPDGRLVDGDTQALPHIGIFAFHAVGTGDEDTARPSTFHAGQPVGLRREPDEHDPHAVALTTGSPARTFGHVPRQHARPVAERLDRGQHLVALVTHAGTSPPRVLITTPHLLAQLRRE
ncbi:HIRAN domain-containing protein [Arthrobacter sp. Soc17.1.1.1]|uniref:HIRAN domain-containing protein n=1 Tax=Arthrobacter sp. Soc17.1.1.1 TaxID=3121277 RepID=UPI002FE4E480